MDDDNIWVISYRKLDILNDSSKESIVNRDVSTVKAVQRVQNADLSTSDQEAQNGASLTLPVRQVQDVKPLEHHVKRVVSQHTEDRHRVRKWLVCLSAFVVMVIGLGFMYAFGTLFIDIMEEFQTSRASAAVIASVLVGVCQGTGVICGALVSRFGPRKVGLVGGLLLSTGLVLSYFANGVIMLDLTVGAISGLGICFLYISNTTAVGLNFNGPSKSLALSLASTGAGVGGLSYPFLLRHLRETFGLQETFLIVGGLTLNTIPCAMLWGAPLKTAVEADEAKNRTEIQREPSNKTQHKSLQLLAILFRSAQYMLFVLGNMCTNAPLTVFNIFITDIYNQKGFRKTDSTFALSLMNIINFFGRLVPGIMKQIPKFSALYTTIFCCTLGAILMTVVNFTVSLAATLVVSAGLGLSMGVFMSARTVTAASLVGPDMLSTGMGLVTTMNGVANFVIGPLSGLVKDVTQSYEFVLYGATVMMACGCVSFSLAFWIRRRQRLHEKR